MNAIGGNPESFMNYLQDPRFASGRVWQLNFLKYEPGDQGKYSYICSLLLFYFFANFLASFLTRFLAGLGEVLGRCLEMFV